MPASPVHHTSIDGSSSWDGPAEEKKFDPSKASNFKKFFSWYETDPETKSDGWGPHHDVSGTGAPGDANQKGVEAAMAALNGARGGNSKIPAGDRQAVWDHLAAHYKDAGVKEEDIPELKRSADLDGEPRSAGPHTSYKGTHTHSHTASGDQGGDATHEHSHSHDGDADHGHSHDDRSSEPAGEARAAQPPDGNDVVDELGDGDDDADDQGTLPAPSEVLCQACTMPNDPNADVCVGCGETLDEVVAEQGEDTGARAIDNVIEDGDAADMESVDDASNGDPGSVMGARSLEPGQSRIRRSADPAVAIIRSRIGQGIELRDGAGGLGTTLFGHFSTFNHLYEIDSFFEGQFLERVMPGAWKKSLKNDRASLRCLFDHGFDPQLGNKPLGPFTVLREDAVGPYYEVPLLDTSYNRDFVLPALQGRCMDGTMRGSLLGASMRFIVTGEEWDRSGKKTKDNPNGLPIRSITEAQVLEAGPVTFPANIGADAGVRSGTDDFIDHLHHDPKFLARLSKRAGPAVVERMLDAMPARSASSGVTRNNIAEEGRDSASERAKQLRRRAAVALRT